MSVSDPVQIKYSGKAQRPALLGTKTILPGEVREEPRWVAELAKAQHPGLFSIVGEADEEPLPEGDDLTQVRGVGEQTALRLQELGIESFAALAAADASEVAKAAKKSLSEVERWQAAAAEMVE